MTDMTTMSVGPMIIVGIYHLAIFRHGSALPDRARCRHDADGQNGELRTSTVQSSCLSTAWPTLYGLHTDIELVRELPARGAEVVFAAAPMPAGKLV
jgi:hypothetical protein